jgi:GGDEF domain-containing protein
MKILIAEDDGASRLLLTRILGHGAALRITASLGAAASAEGVDWRTVVERGDAALYLAKRNGRNRVVTWTPPVER